MQCLGRAADEARSRQGRGELRHGEREPPSAAVAFRRHVKRTSGWASPWFGFGLFQHEDASKKDLPHKMSLPR
jgi:hypothetical protein